MEFLQNKIDYIFNNIPQNYTLKGILICSSVIGCYKLLKAFYQGINLFYRHCFWQPLYFQKLYGNYDSWVVVTGGSDGIGFEYCKLMAGQGFNICIISRNSDKMSQKLKEIQIHGQSCGQKEIKTRQIQANFGEIQEFQEYQKIAQKLQDIDIAIIFLNAGDAIRKNFQYQTFENIQYQINLNLLSTTYILKSLLSKQLNRSKRSALVFTSAGLSLVSCPGQLIYTSLKSYMSNLSQGLSIELKDKIDVLTFYCGSAKTKMNPIGFEPAQNVAYASLKDLGRRNHSFGSFHAELFGYWFFLYWKQGQIHYHKIHHKPPISQNN